MSGLRKAEPWKGDNEGAEEKEERNDKEMEMKNECVEN